MLLNDIPVMLPFMFASTVVPLFRSTLKPPLTVPKSLTSATMWLALIFVTSAVVPVKLPCSAEPIMFAPVTFAVVVTSSVSVLNTEFAKAISSAPTVIP